MITYSAPKREFINQCRADENGETIAKAVSNAMKIAGISSYDESQIRAWKNSLPAVAGVLNKTSLSDNAIVAIEYEINQTHKRIDFIITGKKEGSRNVIIIELKQWSTVQKSTLSNKIFANVANGKWEDVLHPSYQALDYADSISSKYDIIKKESIGVYTCSFLHNMPMQYSGIMNDVNAFPEILKSPCFLKDDIDKLVNFIDSHVREMDTNLLSDIDSSEIVVSMQLSDMLLDALHGNSAFSYDERQRKSIDVIKETVKECLKYDDKRTIIIKGGPGTGKSVVALNVLGELTKPIKGEKTGYNAVYFTVNSAPRKLYSQELLQGDFKKSQLESFFKYPGKILTRAHANGIDCAFFDEAHRLFDFKGGVGLSSGAHILDEAIRVPRVSVFFIDEDQMVTRNDFATIKRIKDTSEKLHKKVIDDPELELISQFRVLGGDRYMSFVKSFLGYDNLKLHYRLNDEYDFRIFDSAKEMHDLICAKDMEERIKRATEAGTDIDAISGKCRVVAGYCYEWCQRYGGSKGQDRTGNNYDIKLDNGEYQAKWNLDVSKEYSWLNDPLSVREVGCIHTCQGLDMNYCGVIIGRDLYYQDGTIRFDKSANAKSDLSSGIRNADDALAEKLIRNTYHVLLTRGIKGTFVYCEDAPLREYLKSLLDLEDSSLVGGKSR